ncbi:grasp-with-spasm system SPASM domain peptide maturase [Chryseobacterium indoltheticum]|uniref:Grasp-with-spasm system SPASM domain peptide maturase n=1 Tax=Chryseobacterium indoltheticum TaxID=254 RepID=A0A3G6N1H0_9FLAO|nr:grasp-with-spasm system SPASM domain peptide maturase [Chryseobacterium indoltheticum]AZA61604.1 grasp-with-spasm system SPASM domain peptide maturase [Chryseobacterium indoltheticum]
MTYFNIFSNILITKGVGRILISDLQRNVSELYPLELYDLTEELKTDSIQNVLKNYDAASKEILQEYIDFLLEKEYGFITQNDWDYNFPPFSVEYQDYNILSNIFIELENINILDKIKESIKSIEIKHIVIYSKNQLSFDELLEIDNKFNNSPVEGIEIFSPFHTFINEDFIQNLNENTSRIYNMVFYGCKKVLFRVKDTFRFTINFTQQDLQISSCGKVNLDYFGTNLPKVLESINHNSCLHKKISIDAKGNIRNCPSMPQSFGNIKDTTLEEALHHKHFKKYWNLTKDTVEVCKDCEFRYICTDCRAYTERTHENEQGLDTSKPLKCGYDPYTGEWEEWSTNPLKQKAIKYCGLSNFKS